MCLSSQGLSGPGFVKLQEEDRGGQALQSVFTRTCVWAACSPQNNQNTHTQWFQDTLTGGGTASAGSMMRDDLPSSQKGSRSCGRQGGQCGDSWFTPWASLEVFPSWTRSSAGGEAGPAYLDFCFTRQRVSTYCVPGMLLGFGDVAGNKRDRDPHPRMGLTIHLRKQTVDKCVKTQARYLPMMRGTQENQGGGCSA